MAEHTGRSSPEHEATTRIQILRAAIEQFAEHGFRGASIRGIARSAGVSAGLVQHHFGTKERLRGACDEWVMHLINDTQFQMLQQGAPPIDDSMVDRLIELEPVIEYLIMSLSSGSDVAAGWFRDFTEMTHEAMTSGRLGPALDPESDDSRAIAATLTAMALGVTAFYRTIQRTLDESDEAELMARVGRARIFLAPDRILGAETRERMLEAFDRYEESKNKPDPR